MLRYAWSTSTGQSSDYGTTGGGALLRVPFKRFLAWHSKTWRCFQLDWLSKIHSRMFPQASSSYVSHQNTRRFGVFRSQVRGSSRREQRWLCHRSQDDQAYPESDWRVALSSLQARLGRSGVSIYPLSMEKAPSLHCYPQTAPGKGFRPTHSFHHKALCLSGVRNQSAVETEKHLVLLQRSSLDRTEHKGTERKLCPCQDTNEQFSGKPSLFLSSPLCLQHYQLVQETVSTSKISERHVRNYPNRVFSTTCPISQNTAPKRAQAASRVHLGANVEPNLSEN